MPTPNPESGSVSEQPEYVPGVGYRWESESGAAPGDDPRHVKEYHSEVVDQDGDMCFAPNSGYPSLFWHKRLPTVRYVFTILTLANLIAFVITEFLVLTNVELEVGRHGKHDAASDAINALLTGLEDAKDEVQITFAGLVQKYVNGKMWSMLVGLCISSFIWPYIKMSWMMAAYLLPSHRIGVRSTEMILLFINAFSKVSLFLVPMAVCLATALHIVIEPSLTLDPGSVSPNGEKLAAIARLWNTVVNDNSQTSLIAAGLKIPIYIAVNLKVAAGGYLWVACVMLNQFIGMGAQHAHYYAHKTTIYQELKEKGGARKASLFRVSGGLYSVGTMLLIITSFALHIAGLVTPFVRYTYGGVVGELLRMTPQSTTVKTLTLCHVNDFVWGDILLELFLVVCAGLVPLLHCIFMIAQWVVPMTVNKHNNRFRMSGQLYSLAIMDITVIVVGCAFPTLEAFIKILLKGKIEAFEGFLSVIKLSNPKLYQAALHGTTAGFTLQAELLDGYWIMLVSIILHWLGYVLTMHASRVVWLSSFTDYHHDYWLVKRNPNTYFGKYSCMVWPLFMPVCCCPIDAKPGAKLLEDGKHHGDSSAV